MKLADRGTKMTELSLKILCGKQSTETLPETTFRILIAPIPSEEIADKTVTSIGRNSGPKSEFFYQQIAKLGTVYVCFMKL